MFSSGNSQPKENKNVPRKKKEAKLSTPPEVEEIDLDLDQYEEEEEEEPTQAPPPKKQPPSPATVIIQQAKAKKTTKKQPTAPTPDPHVERINDRVRQILQHYGVDADTEGKVYLKLYRDKPEDWKLPSGRTIPLKGHLRDYTIDELPTEETVKKEFGGGTYRIVIRGPSPKTGTGEGIRGTIPYEILAGLSPRIPRRYVSA